MVRTSTSILLSALLFDAPAAERESKAVMLHPCKGRRKAHIRCECPVRCEIRYFAFQNLDRSHTTGLL